MNLRIAMAVVPEGAELSEVPWGPVITSKEEAHRLLDVLLEAQEKKDYEIMNRHLRELYSDGS